MIAGVLVLRDEFLLDFLLLDLVDEEIESPLLLDEVAFFLVDGHNEQDNHEEE